MSFQAVNKFINSKYNTALGTYSQNPPERRV